ncbi:MAG: DUF3316 domain-containing protein [Bacteroidaceae bacterium]|nr:DUF3316 domain-containing protein [Bacteroidaceae bacterium]
MKRHLFLVWVLVCMTLHLSAQSRSEGRNYPITRSTMYGLGTMNLYDTYLSPVEYEGVQARVLRESSRTMQWCDEKVSRQVLFQGHVGMAMNRAETSNELSGMVNWNYALHYNISLFDGRLRLLAGPMMQVHGGFIYNTRNGNNPAQAKLYTNVAASGMALYNINWKRCPITLRYQVDVPVMGVMFSPEYGQSYYEIFSLGHTEGTVHFTSLHNQPTMRHWLTADVNFRKLTLRVGYMADMQQTSVGGLKSHDYSSSFMVGFVKNLRIID